MDDREPSEFSDDAIAAESDPQSNERGTPPPPPAASFVSRLVLTALGGLVCLFLWPAGGQVAIVALVVLAVLVWFGPWLSGSPPEETNDSFTSPPEPD